LSKASRAWRRGSEEGEIDNRDVASIDRILIAVVRRLHLGDYVTKIDLQICGGGSPLCN
jgi:hypothetical protein